MAGFAGDGTICVDIDECSLPKACSPDAVCTNTPGSHDCVCNPGFEGDGKSCVDIDECAVPNDCKPYWEKCVNTPGSHECKTNLLQAAVRTYAPRIHMDPEEEFFPVSVSGFQKNVHLDGMNYVTNDPLDEPSDSTWMGAAGEPIGPDAQPPVYAFVVPGKNAVPVCDSAEDGPFIDVIYFTFFSYNRGKNVCIGYYYDNYCPVYCPWPYDNDCCVPRLDGCAGGYTVFGNHVGDWEHVTVRLAGDDKVGYHPIWVAGSAHTGGSVKSWAEVEKIDTHPITYEARGSHGEYFEPGCHIYQDLPNGDVLQDCTGAGVAWDTWKNVTVVEGKSPAFSCHGDDGTENAENCSDWLNKPDEFRWGNPSDGCGVLDVFDTLAGECRLNAGPTGPKAKSFVSDPNACE
jgi:hypothetical protein